MKRNQNRNILISILAVLIAIVLISFLMVRFRGNSNIVSQEIIENLMAENENNPEAVKYLVTDNCISRVYPETEVKTFVTNFSEGEVVGVYKDKACTQEVTDGFVMSGMYAKYEENDRVFEISVLGDIDEKTKKGENESTLNGDGVLNQIELTRDIREYVESENWRIEEEVERKSADVNCNGVIDENAVNTIVDYIVFGKLNIPETEIIEKPTVEVIEGELNTNSEYNTVVKVKVTEKYGQSEDNGITVYKISGDIEQEYTNIKSEDIINLEDDGIYKIAAYTYGPLGNKSKQEYQIIRINRKAEYKIEYYLENLDGTYSLVEEDSKTIEGKVGEIAQIPEKLYTGYNLNVDNGNSKLQGEVLADGALVLKAYYARNTYSVTINSGENVHSIKVGNESNNDTITVAKKWGEKIEIDAVFEDIDGYEYKWKQWQNENNEDDVIEEKNTTIVVPQENITYTAVVERKLINYSISYDLANGSLETGITNPSEYTVETESFTLNNLSKSGYTFTGWTGGVIDENGEIDNTAKTGVTANTVEPQPRLTIQTGSIGNRKYTANWSAITNTPYTVKHYKETLVDGEFVLAETENLGGTTDTKVEAEIKNYEGFTSHEDNEDNVLEGIVTADGELVLEVYYTRNSYSLNLVAGSYVVGVSGEKEEITSAENSETLESNEDATNSNNTTEKNTNSIEEEQNSINPTNQLTKTITVKYEQNITIDAIIENELGYSYSFIQWDTSNATILSAQTNKNASFKMPAGDLTLTANAQRTTNQYTIQYNLQEGSLEAGKQNPETYTVEIEDITLNNPTKEGYNFIGWTGGVVNGNGELDETSQTGTTGNIAENNPQLTVTIQTGSIGNRKYTANWEKATYAYTIEYYYDGVKDSSKTENLEAKFEDVITFEDVIATDSTKDKNITGYKLQFTPNSITISTNPSQNVMKVYYIKDTYTLTLVAGNNINQVIGQGDYLYQENVEISAVVKNILGYEIRFKEWTADNEKLLQGTGFTENKTNPNFTFTMPAGDVTITASALKELINYQIEYILNDGVLETGTKNPLTYNVETETFTLNNPTKEGYNFLGWTEGNETTPSTAKQITKGNTGNKVFTANWEVADFGYRIEYYYDDVIDNTKTENLTGKFGSTISAYLDKNITGYKLKSEPTAIVLTANSNENVMKVYYEKDSFTLTLISDENIAFVSGQGVYKYQEEVNISSMLKKQLGYEIKFVNWSLEEQSEILSENQNFTFTMPAGNITIKANSSKTAIEYTIEYELDNGSLANSETNPSTYTVETETFELNNPSKFGYSFVGWYGGVVSNDSASDSSTSGDNTAQTGTTGNVDESNPENPLIIQSGSIGNRKYTAKYAPLTNTPYTVEYYKQSLTGEYVLAETENLEGTTGEDITLVKKNYIGFTFDETNSNNVLAGKITANGELVLKAYYTRNSYTLTLSLGDNIKNISIVGDIKNSTNEIEKTLKYEEEITIDSEVKDDTGYIYNWEKWESSNKELLLDQSNNQSTIKMPAGDIQLTAKGTREIINYTINYDLKDGTLGEEDGEQITNPVSYNIETESFTLNNPTKTGYTFVGWTGGVVNQNGEIDLGETTGTTGNITIPQITVTIEKGSIGNRKYTSNWEANENTQYMIEYYLENLDGTYTKDESSTQIKQGVTGETVTAESLVFTGYTENVNLEDRIPTGIIAPDGSLVLKLYYDRNTYSLTLKAGENISSVGIVTDTGNNEENTTDTGTIVEKTFKFGTQINISAVLKEQEGYTVTWKEWLSADSNIITNQAIQNAIIGMPMANVTLTATATKTTNKYNYSVEYYYDGQINTTKTVNSSANYGGIISSYTNKNVSGYEFEKTENLPLTIGVNEENNVIKVYYIQSTYTIDYELNGGTLGTNDEGAEITNPSTYKVSTPSFTLNNPEKQGYTFTGWTGGVVNSNGEIDTTAQTGTTGNIAEDIPESTVTIELGSIGNRKYTANWLANTDTKYTVEHYLENVDGTYTKDAIETLYGETDLTVTATPKTYDGYTENMTYFDRKATGIVTADGNLVLKLYYNRNSYKLMLLPGENVESIGITGETVTEKEFKFGEQISITADLMTEENYTITFSKWESSNPSLLANQSQKDTTITMPKGDITLTAVANKAINKYGYSVKYYYAGELDNQKTVTGTADFGTSISNYTDKNITGFALEKAVVRESEELPLVISANSEENVINVYYTEINYNIEYDLAGGELENTNQTTYTVRTPSFTLNNPAKQGYTFVGWTGGVVNATGELDTTLPTGTTGNIEVETPQENVTIEQGSIGNRKYTAVWRANTDTLYTIEYYFEELDGTYTLNSDETEQKYATTGETVTAVAKAFDHYTENSTKAERVATGEVQADGSLRLKLYYDRNLYKLTLALGENISSIGYKNVTAFENAGGDGSQDETQAGDIVTSPTTIEVSFKFGTVVNIYSELEQVTGYNVTFSKWQSNNTTLIGNQTQRNVQITMPKGDVELQAIATKEKANFEYTVKYYYNGIEDESKRFTTLEQFEKQVITYEEKLIDGYELDRVVGIPLVISANEDENVIEVYYIATNYTIIYDLDEGSLGTNEQGEDITNPTTYTINTETFTLNNPTKENYIFLGWTGGVIDSASDGTTTEGETEIPQKTLTIEKGSTGNRKYTANWEEIIYKVTVHHYLNGTTQKVAEDELITSKEIGTTYITDHLIPEVDENGVSIETDERSYLNPKEFYVITPLPENAEGTFTSEDIEVTYYYDYYPVVEIIDSPVEALVGTKYKTISLALQVLDDVGLTKEDGASTLKLIRDSNDETVTVENQNVILDLNGFTANSNAETTSTFTVVDSMLTIVDDSVNQTGTVTSQNSSAIYVKTTGEFTLGREEKPVNQSPLIEGKTVGVQKEIDGENQGIFNFFDGKILGETAVIGTVDLTPLLYNATVTTDSENKHVSVLAVVSGIEARIGRKTYTQLEDAISDANTVIGADGSQVEIVVVKDLAKSQKVVIDETKNIKLDIEGHTITNTVADYVFENRGNLEIVDSTADDDNPSGTGKIDSTTYNTILNSYTVGEVVDKYTADDLITPGLYGFEDNEGKLVSTNTLQSSTVANSYVKLDLSELEGEYVIVVNAEISSQSGNDYGYATITQDTTVPEYNTTTGRIMYISGEVEAQDYTEILYGGYVYYLHLGYRKDGSKNTGKDTLTINNIILNKKDSGNLTIRSGQIGIDLAGSSSSYKRAIYNNGNVYIENGNAEGENVLYENNIYSFKKVNGVIESQNAKINTSLANSYIEIDLSQMAGLHELVINAQVSSKANEDYGYATIKENNAVPEYTDEEGRFMLISGTVDSTDYSITLDGGKKYYLHLGYIQNNTSYSGDDKLTINSIKLDNEEINVVNNIRPYFYSSKKYTSLVDGYGKVTVNNGLLYTTSSDSKGIQSGGSIVINGGVINTYSTARSTELNSDAYLGAILEINGGVFNSSVSNSSSEKLVINNGYFYKYINYNNLVSTVGEIIINNGIFKSYVYNSCYGKLQINNGIFYDEISYYSDSGSGFIEINNGTFYDKIENKNADKLDINSGLFYGQINNAGSGIINIRGGEINTGSTASINNNATGTINIYDCNVTSTTNTVYNYSTGTINIYEGDIKTTSTTNPCVFNNKTGTINIGNKEDEEISTEVPNIQAIEGYGVQNISGTLNFYDGVITSRYNSTIRGRVNEVPDGTEVLINNIDGKEIATVGIPTVPVAKIGETTYTTLQSAIDAVPEEIEETTTIELLKNVHLIKTCTIPENKNIKIDTKKYVINGLVNGYSLENNGILEIVSNPDDDTVNIDFSNKIDKDTYHFIEQDGKLISNNTGKNSSTANSYIPIDLRNYTGRFEVKINAEVSSQSADHGYATITETTTMPAYSSTAGRFIYISGETSAQDYTTVLNGGKIHYLHLGYYKNSSISVGNDQFIINSISLYSIQGRILSYAKNSLIKNTNELKINDIDINLYASGTSSSYLDIITNTGNLVINSGTIDSGASAYGYIKLINSNENGNVEVNGGSILSDIDSSGTYGIYNNSAGDVVFNDGIINSVYGIYNNSTGNVIVNNGTITTASYSIYNGNEGSIEITGGEVKSSFSYGIYNNSTGNVVVSGGTITASSSYGIYNPSTGNIEITGGTIAGSYGINNSTGTVKIVEGTITARYGIENDTGTVKIAGGTIIANR